MRCFERGVPKGVSCYFQTIIRAVTSRTSTPSPRKSSAQARLGASVWWWTGGDAPGALYGRATNERFALKTINLQGLTDDLHERVVNESLILARMHHQNIVKL